MRALIGIGANLGDRESAIARSYDLLAATKSIRIVHAASLHETRAVGGPSGQPPFLNSAAILETSLAPLTLLKKLKRVEQDCGRSLAEPWSARTLDLDLLLCEERILDRRTIRVPHRFLPFRRFVLDPACEIAGDWNHPLLHCTLAELRRRLIEQPARFAFAGFPLSMRNELLERVRNEFRGDTRISLEVWHEQAEEPRAVFFLDGRRTIETVLDDTEPNAKLARALRRRILSDRIAYLMLDPHDFEAAVREVCGAIAGGFQN